MMPSTIYRTFGLDIGQDSPKPMRISNERKEVKTNSQSESKILMG